MATLLARLLVEPLLVPLPDVVRDAAWAMSTRKASTLLPLMMAGGAASGVLGVFRFHC
jgi:hypothetical protein